MAAASVGRVTPMPDWAARCRRLHIEALCACGPLGLTARAGIDCDRVLAAVLVGALSRHGGELRVDACELPSLELHAVPETDWLAWDRLQAMLPAARPALGACHGPRRLVRFQRCAGLPGCREAEPRCRWTRCWLDAAALSAAATPTAPRSAW